MCHCFAPIILVVAILSGVRAGLDLDYSVSQQCTPLNITWTPTDSGYPYTVWIMGNLGFVDAYRINKDYQPEAERITFQYVVPAPSMGLNSFVVAVADSAGNGNSTRPLGIATPSGVSTSCDPYTAFLSWQWAGDPTVGDMVECGNVRFYNIGDRGTRPFTLSWVPIQGVPITVEIPANYTTNISTFIYNAVMPFQQGTQFQIVLGDATGGGSGGASQIYTAGSSSNHTCLDSGYQLPDTMPSIALPVATNVATYRNLAGAISTAAVPTGSRSTGSHVGAIAGGAIGGAIALGVAIGCLIAFLVWRKRQGVKRKQARQVDEHFVDLDGDGVSQSYTVSPFVYESAGYDDSVQHQNLEMLSRSSHSQSWGNAPLTHVQSRRHDSSYGDLLAAAGLDMSRTPSGSHTHGGISSHSHGSQQAMLPSPSRQDPLTPPHASYAAVPSHRDSQSSGFFRLANGDPEPGPSDEADPLPNKRTHAGNSQTVTADGVSRRVVMHSDGGPLPQPTSDDEEDDSNLDELPPQYGGWLPQNDAHQTETRR